jgi:hypothetical protein
MNRPKWNGNTPVHADLPGMSRHLGRMAESGLDLSETVLTGRVIFDKLVIYSLTLQYLYKMLTFPCFYREGG